MAIYIRTIALREIDSIEKERERLFKILKSTKLELDFWNENHFEIKSLEWKLIETDYRSYFELKLFKTTLKLFFDNPNFIEFLCSDGWDIREFGKTEKNRDCLNGIREIYRRISRNYGIIEVFYFSEWFFDPDSIREGESSFENFKDLIASNPYIEMPEFWKEWKNGYFVEKINPVANNAYNTAG